MKPERDFNMILAQCLDALQRGVCLKTILGRFPDEAGRLQPLLKSAQFVIQTPNPKPSKQAVIGSKGRMMRTLAEQQVASQRQKKTVLDDLGLGLQQKRGKGLVIFIFCLVLAFILLSSLGVSAAESLPGSWLYPVKLALQDLHLMLIFDPIKEQQRQAFYDRVRQQDLLTAVEQGRIPKAEAQATLTAMPTPAPTWTPQE